jgi:hypothetical protein
MVDVDVGRDGKVWACDAKGRILYREGISVKDVNGESWSNQSSGKKCKSITVCTSGHVWMVGHNNKVFFREGITDKKLVGTSWSNQTPRSMRVA